MSDPLSTLLDFHIRDYIIIYTYTTSLPNVFSTHVGGRYEFEPKVINTPQSIKEETIQSLLHIVIHAALVPDRVLHFDQVLFPSNIYDVVAYFPAS